MLGKLALRNVKRQTSSYIIYFITVVFTVALMFSINNILFTFTKKINELFADRSESVTGTIILFVVLITFVVGFIICYATAFLFRKRKKEFGTYLLLGINRSAVLRIFIIENLIIGACSFLLGCILGLGLFQVLNAFVCAIMGNNFGPLSYSFDSIWLTLLQWVIIFAAAIVYSAFILYKAKINDLLKEKTIEIKTSKNQRLKKIILLSITLSAMVTAGIILYLLLRNVFDLSKHEQIHLRYNRAYVTYTMYVAGCLAVLIAGIFIVPKKPWVERIIALFMLIVFIGACAVGIWMFVDAFGFYLGIEERLNDLVYNVVAPNALGLLIAAIFIFYFYSRSFYSSKLNRPKKFKGSNVFHYRQMTSALSSNVAMMGTIAIMLSLAFFFSNFAYSARYVSVEEINQYTPYDVIGRWSHIEPEDTNNGFRYKGWPDDVVKEAEKYSPVTFKLEYSFYDTGEKLLGERWLNTIAVKESDLNNFLKSKNKPEYQIADNEFYIFFDDQTYMDETDFSGLKEGGIIKIFDKDLTFKGAGIENIYQYMASSHQMYAVVAVSDNILQQQEWEECRAYTVLLMNTKNYLPPDFYYAFAYSYGYGQSNVQSRYMEIDRLNADSAVMIVCVLFFGITFMFFAMALLSLKTMSDADRDKKRYAILNMLGVSEGKQRKIMFRQILSFFTIPLLIPFLIAIPSIVFSALWSYYSLKVIPAAIYLIGVSIPLIYSGIYICYFAATYYLSVKNIIASIEKPKVKLLADD